jgi:glutathione synthase/RimK-type ligase-like ATP-grasp enzyme
MLKTIAIMFDHVAINRITSCWLLRNRIYSLKLLRDFGIEVPLSIVGTTSVLPMGHLPYEVAVKAVGNCYVSDDFRGVDDHMRRFFSLERDGDEIAVIFPASVLSQSELKDYSDSIGVFFAQERIRGRKEIRVYFIGDDVFVYERESVNSRFDGSFARLLRSKYIIDSGMIRRMRNFMEAMHLRYVCIDAIVRDRKEIVIDVNPYGSLPEFSESAEPWAALARAMTS